MDILIEEAIYIPSSQNKKTSPPRGYTQAHQKAYYQLNNELIIQELIEYIQLLHKELVKCFNYNFHDSDTVSLDRIQHLIYSNCLDLFSFSSCLNKNLSVKIVIIF